MWSDNDIDNAFRRLDPAEPEPTPFPLDAWLKLEAGLDQAVIDRAVHRRLWQFFAAEVAVVALVGLGWSLWPTSAPVAAGNNARPTAAAAGLVRQAVGTTPAPKPTATLLPEASAPTAPTVATLVAPATLRPRPASTDGAALFAGHQQAASPAMGAAPAAMVAAAGRKRHLAVAGAWSLSARALGSSAGRLSAEGHTVRFARNAATPTSLAGQYPALNGPTPTVQPEPGSPTMATVRPALADAAAAATAHPEAASSAATVAAAPGRNGGTATLREASSATPEALSGNGAPSLPGTESGADVPAPVPLPTVALATPAALLLPGTLPSVALAPSALPAVLYQPRFFVGLLAAPDLSTVQFADLQGAHLNVGLTLEYRLGQRWRVSTGVQRATKDYYARRQDYDFSAYPKAYTRDFNWVDASCTVVDVPLNLRYDAVVAPRYRVFGSAGLSSFFMQREHYSYEYYDDNNAAAVWDRSFVNANRHLFSILNLSMGYEYSLGTHWRLQGEPYVKMPLGGVGVGKVKLLSAGVYLGVKYGF